MKLRFKDILFGTTTFTPPSLCSMPEGEGDGGGSGASNASGAQQGDAQKDTSVLSDAKQAEASGDGSKDDGKDSNDDKSKDKPPANETPEEKTAREAKEKEAKDKKVADTLKTYDALKLPDGLAKDHPIAQEFLKDAAERGMSAEDTQAMVTRMGPKLVEAINKPYDAWADMQKTWIESLPKDKEFGGANFKENLGTCALAIDTLFPEAAENKSLREMFAFTGVGNHPDMVRLLYRVGKAMKEGAPIGGKPKVDQVPLAQKMYPTMAQT